MSTSETQVTIESKDDCSEIYLQDNQYTIVARGVGRLSASVAPGLYKVRQRIGDNETSHVIDVPAAPSHHFTLEGVKFPSPIPLEGTNTSREFQQAALNVRAPTAQASGTCQFSLLLRDPRWAYGEANPDLARALMQEASRLNVESLDGTYNKKLLEIAEQRLDAGFIRLCVELAPGQYVLTQKLDEQSQRCLPLRLLNDWTLHVFFQMTTQLAENGVRCMDIDQASIVYGRPGTTLQPSDPNLRLLETARKAFSRRRTSVATDIVDRVLNGKFGNPVLGLLGAHLLLNSPDVDAAKALLVVDNTAALLGEEFPDVIALRLRLAALKLAKPQLRPPVIDGPPLVVASYYALTRVPEYLPAPDLSKVFWFPFTAEPTSTWFVWNEAPNVRASGQLPEDDEVPTEFGFRARGPHRAQPPIQQVLQTLLSSERLQAWFKDLKKTERQSGSAPAGLGPLDRTLLSVLASAQASLVPGVIDAEAVTRTIVSGLNVPAATARRSAAKLLTRLQKWSEPS